MVSRNKQRGNGNGNGGGPRYIEHQSGPPGARANDASSPRRALECRQPSGRPRYTSTRDRGGHPIVRVVATATGPSGVDHNERHFQLLAIHPHYTPATSASHLPLSFLECLQQDRQHHTAQLAARRTTNRCQARGSRFGFLEHSSCGPPVGLPRGLQCVSTCDAFALPAHLKLYSLRRGDPNHGDNVNPPRRPYQRRASA